MKLNLAAYALASSGLAAASNSFAGSSLYFLPGLSASDQANYIDTLASYGAKVVRIWINKLDTGCVKGSNVVTSVADFETTIGTYNWNSLAAVDKVLAQLAAKGMKAIISPHDGNDIHDSSVTGNGCDIYCHTYGTSFYGNSNAQAQYDARIKAILTYKSPSSGLAWGNWSEAILAFDLENEPFQFTSDGANNDPSNWLCNRAANFKKYISDSNIKVATGGIGGDQSHGYNMLPKALSCSSIDLMSVHAYVGSASTWGSIMPGFEASAAANNKLVYVEEWGVATSYPSDFNDQSAALNSIAYPWLYWQMIPGDDGTESCNSGCCTGYDGFEIGFNSGKGNLQYAISQANTKTTKQDWSFVGAPPAGGSSPPSGGGGGSGGNGYPADTCTWGRPTLALADTAVTAPGDVVVGIAARLSLATPTTLVSTVSATTLDRQLKGGFSESTGVASYKSDKTPSFPMCRWV
ncbi:probable mannan endo-1,4-beta-mannosidase F [Trichoderma asperellum]|uniref:Probable mannan endo-1,4-beta-mannosidase F n=1 Tax=Trichoderma asperellum TaxID=101201 RepID=A0A6V8R4X3_TRIAP|nr:probable mannan endo-1,4-beta-mannosidase F [Trichoderma asperellum]